jgi:steroid delta-isomerase-like uncharacterized protein
MNNSKRAAALMVFLFAVSMILQVQSVSAQSNDDMKAMFGKSLKTWNEGNVEVIDEVYSADIVRHGADGQEVVGAEAFKAYIGLIRTIYPDFNVVVNGEFGSGDMLAAHWTVTGTNKGALSEEIPATGKSIKISGVTILKFQDGKIAEEWAYWNHGGPASVMTQLGFTLAPPMMAKKE